MTLTSGNNLLSDFCSNLTTLNSDCKSQNPLCHSSLTSVTAIRNYSGECNSDSTFNLNIHLLLQSSSKCKSKSVGKVEGGKYLWMTLFAKNDARNVIESIVWHLLLGVDHVVVYDNNSIDNLAPALEPLVSALLVSRIPWDGIGIPAQQAAYRNSIRSSQEKHISWLAIMDVDEYILPIRDKCLPKMLSRFDSEKKTSALVLNWRMMPGVHELSHRTDPYETIFERTRFSLGYPNRHIKTILQPSLTKGLLTAHAASYATGYTAVSVDSGKPTNDSFNYPPQVRDAVILHYHVKSLEEWVAKKDRWSDGMNAKRCPACHQPLEEVVKDWLKMKKFENDTYNREFHRHCDDKTDHSTIAFMKLQSALIKGVLTLSSS